jgi:ubiquitin carboxyl-terminal hydrolase 4/11/15
MFLTILQARSEDSIRRKILQKLATFTKHEAFSRKEESDSADSTDFAANGSDLSSNEGKVVAQSVQGEDDYVDVTMTDTGDTKAQPT